MKKKGFLLTMVAVGIVAVAAVVPLLVANSQENVAVNKAFDESNKVYWTAESAACQEYKNTLRNKSINLDNMTIKTKGNHIADGLTFKYGNFEANSTVEHQKTLHGESACWSATGSAEGYDFQGQVKSIYTKPGVEFTNYGNYAWDKHGNLFLIKEGKLKRDYRFNKPVWQCNHDLVLDTNGNAKYLYDGTAFSDENDSAMVAATIDKNYFALSKTKKVKYNNGNGHAYGHVKWKKKNKKTDKDETGEVDVVFAIGGSKHVLALAENGDLYGWGDNSSKQITKIAEKNGKTKDYYSVDEAVLITDKESIPNETSNSYVDLTPYVDKTNPIASYLEAKYGKHPHHCRRHSEYNSNCLECWRRNEMPWGGDSLANNCDCELCQEIRDVTKYDNRSKHLDKCHCDVCQMKCEKTGTNANSVLCTCRVCRTKRDHYWTCHCDACLKERGEFWGVDTVKSNEVPNPSTPLHVDEATKVDNFQVMLDANSAYFSTNDFYSARVLGGEYRSVVEYRAKLIPKNPPETDNPGDVGSLKYNSDDMDNIYVIDGGKVDRNETDFYDPLKKTWLVDFPAEVKQKDKTVNKLPAGDYEVIFESRFQIEKRGRFLFWATSEWEPVSGMISDWSRVAPFNMFWGIDANGNTNNNNYYGGIFRLNNNLFNLTGGKTTSEENHTVKMTAAGDTFSILLAKNDADSKKNPNMYKVLTWGANSGKQLGRKNTETGMSEVVFPGDDKKNNKYQAKHIVSMKAGSNQGLVLTDEGKIFTWGANKYETPQELSLTLDAPAVSIAAGNNKNMLITENDTVYMWDSDTLIVNQNHKISY